MAERSAMRVFLWYATFLVVNLTGFGLTLMPFYVGLAKRQYGLAGGLIGAVGYAPVFLLGALMVASAYPLAAPAPTHAAAP